MSEDAVRGDAVDQVRALVAPLLPPRQLELWDVTSGGGVLRVLVDRAGGVDLEVLGELTRLLSVALDERDPIPGRYTLEVSSPGLERTLRTPEHFTRSVGEVVSVKTTPGTDGDRRCTGTLSGADDAGITVRLDQGAERHLRYDQIAAARTVFEWGPAPKPTGPAKSKGTEPAITTTTTTTKAATR